MGHKLYIYKDISWVINFSNTGVSLSNTGKLLLFLKALNLGHIVAVKKVPNVLQKIALVHELGLGTEASRDECACSHTCVFISRRIVDPPKTGQLSRYVVKL